MSLGRHNYAGRPGDDAVDTVDLTISSDSSPEPQLRPRPRPRPSQHHVRQHQLPSHLNIDSAPPPSRPAVPSNSSEPRITANPALPLPSIVPEHLRSLINTSPPEQVRDLLLDLCKSSPALSGAVARGLAPHSAWAQQTIRDYRKRNGLERVRPDPESSSSERLVPRPSIKKEGHAQPNPPRPKVPVEPEADDTSDGSLSDLEVLFEKPVSSTNPSQKSIAGPSSSAYSNKNDATRQDDEVGTLAVRVKPEPKATGTVCTQCHQTYERGSTCRFHPGRRIVESRGTEKIHRWKCCNKPISVDGCCLGDHVPWESSSVNGTSALNGSKKPRLI